MKRMGLITYIGQFLHGIVKAIWSLKKLWKWINNWHDVLQLFLTIGAMAMAYYLYTETQGQVYQSKRANNLAEESLRFQKKSDSLNAITQQKMADNSIALSKKIANTQERFAKIDTRAYVTLENAQLSLITGKPISIELTFHNSGRTPANNLRVRIYQKLGGTGIYKEEVDNLKKSIIDSQDYAAIGPGPRTVTFNDSPVFTQKDSIDYYRHNISYFVHGMAFYKDMFGDEDTTSFTFKVNQITKFQFITQYNDVK